jgi:hypothetical protein
MKMASVDFSTPSRSIKGSGCLSSPVEAIPGRDLHPALSGGWLGTRYTHPTMYISSYTLSGLNFKVSVEVHSQH